MNTDRTKNFTKFLTKELEPAIDDIEKLDVANRKHVQKLVYTNLVDRFDHLVDSLVLHNCREDQLVSRAFENNDAPVTEKELFGLLLQSNDLQSALETRLQNKLRLSVLRQRHSRKLATLLSLFDGLSNYENVPRVNPSTGEISEKFKVQIKTTPHSICGYADWLYSRRNAVVHGAGTAKFLENDVKQIKKLYKVDVTKTFKISLSSIRTATKFYRAVCEILETN